MTTWRPRAAPPPPPAPGGPAIVRGMDSQTRRAGLVHGGVLHELGDAAVVDAVVYGAFVAAGGGCYDLFARVVAWFWEERA